MDITVVIIQLIQLFILIGIGYLPWQDVTI